MIKKFSKILILSILVLTVLFACSKNNNENNIVDDQILYTKALEKSIKYMKEKKVVKVKEFQEIRIYPNTTKKAYKQLQCAQASMYEQRDCERKIRDSEEFRAFGLQVEKIDPKFKGGKEGLINGFIMERCKKASASSRELCEKKLTINNEYFSHIGENDKITIVHFLKNDDEFASPETLLIFDVNINNVIGYFEFSGAL